MHQSIKIDEGKWVRTRTRPKARSAKRQPLAMWGFGAYRGLVGVFRYAKPHHGPGRQPATSSCSSSHLHQDPINPPDASHFSQSITLIQSSSMNFSDPTLKHLRSHVVYHAKYRKVLTMEWGERSPANRLPPIRSLERLIKEHKDIVFAVSNVPTFVLQISISSHPLLHCYSTSILTASQLLYLLINNQYALHSCNHRDRGFPTIHPR
jgi:hypothetical protein